MENLITTGFTLIGENWQALISAAAAFCAALVALASAIVRLTRTKKDDEILAKIVNNGIVQAIHGFADKFTINSDKSQK